MDKHDCGISDKEILLSRKKKRNIGTRYNADGLEQQYAVGKKPGTKGHILHGSTYVEYPEPVSPETEPRLVAAWNGQGRRVGVTASWARVPFWVMKKFWN